jgi:hypothetical protein
MKDIRIPILFAVAAIVFSMISMLSCQSEDNASHEELSARAEVEVIDESTSIISQDEEEPMTLSEARNTNMRYGPR